LVFRVYDAIEFDEGMATIDTLYDLAFLLMDWSTKGDAQEDDHSYDDKAYNLSRPSRQTASEQEDQDQRIGEAVEDLLPQRPTALAQRIIGAVANEALFRLGLRHAGRCCPQLGQHEIERPAPRPCLGQHERPLSSQL
jgi:hypothetical protein